MQSIILRKQIEQHLKFTPTNDYVLEAMVFYMMLESQSGSVNVTIRHDNNGLPGDPVSDLAQWNVVLNPLSQTGYNLIVTTDLCIYLDSYTSHLYTIEAATDSIYINMR